ncbi:MAG: hypothetical protein HY814_04185 [Candidatus Riflebacteria bacterium]|nr:hypothetical protein [Candidatus Riflebacteria bacterium]
MKALKLLGLASTLAFFCCGCATTGPAPIYKPETGIVHQGRKVYFSMRDPKGDDNGPGGYLYPLRFDNREGFFDLERFQVEDGGSNVVFRITTRRPIDKFRTDGSSEAKGWHLQLMDIYIDKDHKPSSGQTRTLPGRCVDFAEDSAWEQMVLVTPNRSEDVERLIESRTNDLELVRLKPKIVIPQTVFIEGFDFVVHVPKDAIGTPQPGWGYQVLMMQFDENNLANFEFQNGKVFKFPTDEHFGGGVDFFGNPAVIDLLAPTEEQQHTWLSAYNPSNHPEESQFATVRCLYAETPVRPEVVRVARKVKGRLATAVGAPAATRRAPVRARSGAAKTSTPRAATSRRAAGVSTKRQAALSLPEGAVMLTPEGEEELPPSPAKAGPLPRPARSLVGEADGESPWTPRAFSRMPPTEPAPRRSVRTAPPDDTAWATQAADESETQPPVARPPAGKAKAGYRRVSFAGDPEELFRNVPRSR